MVMNFAGEARLNGGGEEKQKKKIVAGSMI